jgi:hypothetical protein
VVALLGALALADAAGAHTLSKERALNASLRGAEKHCENDGPNCDTFDAGDCRRPPGSGHRRRHKVQCDVFLGGTDSMGEWQCTWVDQWTLTKRNKLRWSQAVYDETLDCHHL